jgi:predicted dithiol-disulfide oxidoreductase (DUF899 family)
MSEKLNSASKLASRRVPRFPNESAEYATARQALLAEEIEARRHLGRVARLNQNLPAGPEIDETFTFLDSNGSKVALGELFGGHETLVLYHWMYGPDSERPCPMCINLLGPLDANAADIEQRVALAIIGRSSVERQIAFARERGWRHLRFFKDVDDDFPLKIGALDPENGWEMPVLMVLRRDGNRIRLHWMGEMSQDMADPGEDPRGHVDLAPLWNILDITPDGRGTEWYPKLTYPARN